MCVGVCVYECDFFGWRKVGLMYFTRWDMINLSFIQMIPRVYEKHSSFRFMQYFTRTIFVFYNVGQI